MNIAVSGDPVNVGVFIPNPAPVISTASHVRINGIPITLVNDVVTSHTNSTVTPNIVHPAATMVSSVQNYVRVNSLNIIVTGDAANCDPTHTITGTGYVQIN